MDLQILDVKKAMDMVDNDESLFTILLEGFLTDAQFDKDRLAELIKQKKFEEATSSVHRVKGAARQLCAEQLAAKGQELEDILRGKTDDDAALQAKECFDLYDKTRKIMSDELRRLK